MSKEIKYTKEQLDGAKEYLLEQRDKILSEIEEQTKRAEAGKVSSYTINIFTKVLKDRAKFLYVLTQDVLEKIKQL